MPDRSWFNKLKVLLSTDSKKDDLVDVKSTTVIVKSVEKGLKLSTKEKKDLGLGAEAALVASAIKKVGAKGQVERASTLTAEYARIVDDIEEAATTGGVTDVAPLALRLKALRAEAELATAPLDGKKQEAWKQAQRTWSTALLAGIVKAAAADETDAVSVQGVIEGWVKAQLEDDPERGLGRVNKALTAWAGGDDVPAATAAKAVARGMTTLMQEDLKGLGASQNERGEVERTPTEVSAQLLSALTKALGADTDEKVVEKSLKKVRKAFAGRQLTVDGAHDLLTDVGTDLKNAGFDELAKLCADLGGQIPARGEKVARTRAHENIYGRVFDSKLVDGLVKDPPPGTIKALGSAGSAIVAEIEKFGLDRFAGDWVKELLTDKDPRFWNAGVPELVDILNGGDNSDTWPKVKKYLSSPPSDGVAAVGFPWLLVKLSLKLKGSQKSAAPWMDAANSNYSTVIMKQSGRENEDIQQHKSSGKIITEGGGITLGHQPTAVKEDWMTPSQRPTTVNRPKLDRTDEDDPVGGTEAIDTALDHEATYASGVSGSTNIMLHMVEHLNTNGAGINTKDFLVGAMMFLVYDGGHSVHEVMWTANQLDGKLSLGLGLGDPDDPNAFVGDSSKLISILDDETSQKVETAQESALDGVVDYFDKNSHYAG
jgi:hypothetical protein